MTRALRLAVLATFCAALAACATQPQADLTPPPMTKRDAKGELESGRQPTLRR